MSEVGLEWRSRTLIEAWLWGFGAVLAATFLLWLWSIRLRDVSIVDSFWSLGFVLTTWIYAYVSAEPGGLSSLQWLHGGLVTLWGARLAGHIAWRHHQAGGEDYRYRTMRERTGPSFVWQSLLKVFWFQGLLISIIGLPLLFAQASSPNAHLHWTLPAFLVLFSIGLFFEAVGDWQLSRFKADPANKGRVLNRGLWRYSRHPNYFGDCVVWWSFWIFACGFEGGVWTLPSTVLMTFFLLKVSGVSLLEKTIVDRRPAYREYIEQTPAFFPWFPKSTNRSKA